MSGSPVQQHPRRRLASSLCAVGLLLTGVVSISAVALPTQEAGAATDVVTNCSGDPSTSGSLPNEIASAGPGDTITFSLSCSTITLTSTIVISQDLTISGPGQTSLAVDGGSTTEPFEVSSGTVSISGLTIQNGDGTAGGAINNSGTLTVSNSALAHNSATDGGAIYNNGNLTVTTSTLSSNSAASDGGAIDNLSTATVQDSTLSANTAGNYGGGIESSDATLTVDNSTVSGNSATSDGGGIDIEAPPNGGSATIDNSTVTSNGAPFGAGIQDDQSPLTIGATIVAESTSGNDCFLQDINFTDQGYNIDDDGSCGFTSPSVSNSGLLDGTLGSLANNGGPTQTVALEPGSPAIGLVANGLFCPGTDQRGAARLTTPCDAGAYDTNGAFTPPSPRSPSQGAWPPRR